MSAQGGVTNRWNNTRSALATALGNASFRRVLPSYFLFACGENGVWLAVSIYAYREGGIVAVGIVSVAQLIPAVLVAPLGAALSERVASTTALAVGYALQFLTTALLALLMLVGTPLGVYAAAVAASCAITLTRPAHHALLPRLATTPAELTAANSLSSVMESLGVMVGPAITALLFAVSTIASVPALFAATWVVAALLATWTRVAAGPDAARHEPHAAAGRVRDASSSLGRLFRNRDTGLLVLLGGGQFLVVGVLDVFCVALAVEVLGRGEGASGLLVAAGGVGALVGAAASAMLIGRVGMSSGIGVGIVVTGTGLGLTPYAPTLAVMLVLIGVAEAGRAFFDVAARTLLQRTVASRLLARMFGVQESLIMLSLAIGAAAAPLLASRFGIRGAFVVSTIAVVSVGAVSWRTLRRLDRRAVLPDPERLDILRRVAIFAPLPQHELEQIAAHVVPVMLPAGSVVIREGEVGDRFYVVAQGEAVVESGERRIARCRRGDYFGEIALLRDVPRTASVTATTAVRLFALNREEFLAAVTGSSTGAAIADAEIDRRLAEL